jgi:hypothetical protein
LEAYVRLALAGTYLEYSLRSDDQQSLITWIEDVVWSLRELGTPQM